MELHLYSPYMLSWRGQRHLLISSPGGTEENVIQDSLCLVRDSSSGLRSTNQKRDHLSRVPEHNNATGSCTGEERVIRTLSHNNKRHVRRPRKQHVCLNRPATYLRNKLHAKCTPMLSHQPALSPSIHESLSNSSGCNVLLHRTS